MPKTLQYRENAVIYFQGDTADKIFLLQIGKVNLTYQDIETNEAVRDSVQPGEFFGVKSALGHHPREENAITSQEATLVVFTIPEFEQLAMSNTRIIMKMLKVFSRQMRRIHQQAANLMKKEGQDEMNPELGLFNVGEYYLKNQRFNQAKYIFGRYLTYYPGGSNADRATQYLAFAENAINEARVDKRDTPEVKAKSSIGKVIKEGEGSESETARAYNRAVNFISQGKSQQASILLKRIIEVNNEPEYTAKSLYEIGRCLFMMNKFEECIQHCAAMITTYPRHPNLGEALLLMGQSHENQGRKGQAEIFYRKILIIVTEEGDPVNMNAKKALAAMRRV
jgi:CRP-like cAMP-binding protein